LFAQLIGGMLFADGGVGLVSVGLIAGAAEWLLGAVFAWYQMFRWCSNSLLACRFPGISAVE